MPTSPIKKRIEEKAFAQAYLDHGMNAKAAALAIKPQLTEGSAGVEGSRLLERVNNSGAIDSIMSGARAHWEEIAKTVMNSLLERAIAHDDKANDLLLEYGKIFASANGGPKTAIQNNKYTLPKR